jgi:hypothetical protein
MTKGEYSADVYTAAALYRDATGASAFEYSDNGAIRVHADLDPKGVNREARDSAEYPETTPIIVLIDITGSMRDVPRKLQARLLTLLTLLLNKGYVVNPAILFGAIGDATCDRAPLQISQFESDNTIDEQLAKLYLEGGGGGQKTESYELAMYFVARHITTDAWDKRRHRGYLIIIADEMAYPQVKAREVAKVIGDELGQDIPLDDIVREVTEKWDTYYILPAGASYVGDTTVLGSWQKLLGQNVIQLEDLDAICETIGLTIGLAEDAVDLAGGLADLVDVGSTAGGVVGKALATLGSSRSPVTVAAPPADLTGEPGNVRL